MAIAIYGITLVSQNPWTVEQTAAVHRACREVLCALQLEQSPSEEEVAAYWQSHVEPPSSAVVYGEVAPYSAFWQFGDSVEVGLLYSSLETHCSPLEMTIASHFSI